MRRLLYQSAAGLTRGHHASAHAVQRHVRATPAQAAALANERLHRYLVYCRTYSPFWRERWPEQAAQFTPEEASAVLELLPRLGKSELRQHMNELRIRPESRRPGDGYPPIRGQRAEMTGGSTGAPVTLYVDDHFVAMNRATIDYFYTLCGLHPGDPFFYVWGSLNELRDIRRTTKKRVSSWLRGMHAFPSYSLDGARIEEFAAETARRPHVQSAMLFASVAETMMRYAEATGLRFRRVKRAVLGGGLVHAELRRLVRKHLADEVFDMYGSRDFGLIACETPAHDGLSVAAWHHTVEVLDPVGTRVEPGAAGELHVTAMNNYSTALLRVAIGDTAAWHPDPGANGVPVPRLLDLRGRSADHIVGPGGVVIDPSAVIHTVGVIINPPWLRKFQLVQHEPAAFRLRVESWNGVPSAADVEALRASFAEHLATLLHCSVAVDVDVVDEIAPLPSGKHQYCVRMTAAPEAR